MAKMMTKMKTEEPEDDGEGESEDMSCDDAGDLGTQLEVCRRRLEKIEDVDDPLIPKLIKERRAIEQKLEIRRLKRRLAEAQAGESDNYY